MQGEGEPDPARRTLLVLTGLFAFAQLTHAHTPATHACANTRTNYPGDANVMLFTQFTVFYPDLIDRTKTPRYILEPSDTKEFCILRFTAGPPYEDVAFRYQCLSPCVARMF